MYTRVGGVLWEYYDADRPYRWRLCYANDACRRSKICICVSVLSSFALHLSLTLTSLHFRPPALPSYQQFYTYMYIICVCVSLARMRTRVSV